MDEDEADEEYDIEDDEFSVEPPAYRYDPVRLLVDVATLCAGIAGSWMSFFIAIGQDTAAHVNYRVYEREFHMAAAKEIETITEEQAHG